MSGRRALLLAGGALLLGIAAELAADQPLALAAGDVAAGWGLIGGGLLAAWRRPGAGAAWLLVAAGVTWFAGNFASPLLYVYRGPLVLALLAYPLARPRGWLPGVVIVAAFADGFVSALGADERFTIALCAALAVAAIARAVGAGGGERRARMAALAASLAVALTLGLGAQAGPRGLQVTLLVAGLGLGAALARRRWDDAVVADLVVDLGTLPQGGVLQARLAAALGDPGLEIGYWLDGACVDAIGRPLDPAGRTVTSIDHDGRPVAALMYDAQLRLEPRLAADVAAVAGLVLDSVVLEADVRARLADVQASRRRIVEAADRERRRLRRELDVGPERRLAAVAQILDGDAELENARAVLTTARADLRELAAGLYPSALTSEGLAGALRTLAGRAPMPVEVRVALVAPSPAIAAAVYYACSEALANIAKYAAASRASVRVEHEGAAIVLEVADDGVGGADVRLGSGLSGLADRAEALGGSLAVDSPAGAGTRVTMRLPLSRSSGYAA